MSNELAEILSGNALANSDLFKSFMDTNDKLAGSGGGFTTRRISLRGMKFRELVNGEQMAVSKDDSMNVVILDVAPVMRTYYEGAYDAEKPAAPKCWSNDTNVPTAEVEEPMASRCIDCPMNVKGSGQGNSRACRYSQRLAVAIENKLDTVYQLSLPATSLFGDANGNKLPMQAYARLLKAHGTPIITVVTKMTFDEDAEVPKLYFQPARPLTEEELEAAAGLRDSEEAHRAITFTVAQSDHVPEAAAPAVAPEPEPEPEEEPEPLAAKPKPKGRPAKKPAPVEMEEEEKVTPPTKVNSKKETASVSNDSLGDLISKWDD